MMNRILSELDKFDQADRKPIAILPLGKAY